MNIVGFFSLLKPTILIGFSVPLTPLLLPLLLLLFLFTTVCLSAPVSFQPPFSFLALRCRLPLQTRARARA